MKAMEAEFDYEVSLSNSANGGSVCVEVQPKNLVAFNLMVKLLKECNSWSETNYFPDMSISFEIWGAFSQKEEHYIFFNLLIEESPRESRMLEYTYEHTNEVFREVVQAIREDTSDVKNMVKHVVVTCIKSYN